MRLGIFVLACLVMVGCKGPAPTQGSCCPALGPDGVGMASTCTCPAGAECELGFLSMCTESTPGFNCVQRIVLPLGTPLRCSAEGAFIETTVCEVGADGVGLLASRWVHLDDRTCLRPIDCGGGRCVPSSGCVDASVAMCPDTDAGP